MNPKVKWDHLARLQFKEAISYIRKDSFANSEKVRQGILEASRALAAHPKKHPADKDKINNDGSYRVFVLYRYRISYKIENSEITILRLRHSSMDQQEY